MIGTLLTAGALAEDGQMTEVGLEVIALAQPLRQRSSHLRVNRRDPLTLPADDVEMLPAGGRVVRRAAVTQVGVPHQAELLEELQVAVDRREVDRRRRPAYLRQDVLGGGVAELSTAARTSSRCGVSR